MRNTDLPLERILANSFTTTDVYKRLLILEDVLKHAIFEDGGKKVNVIELLKKRGDASEAVAAWGEPFLSLFTKESIQDDIQNFKDAIATLPTLVLYTPVVFERKQIEEIGMWCRTNIDARILLDVRIDPQSLGGCMFVWHDILHDFSLRYFLKRHATEFQNALSAHVGSAHQNSSSVSLS